MTLLWKRSMSEGERAVISDRQCAEDARERLYVAVQDTDEVTRVTEELRTLRLRNHFKNLFNRITKENV